LKVQYTSVSEDDDKDKCEDDEDDGKDEFEDEEDEDDDYEEDEDNDYEEVEDDDYEEDEDNDYEEVEDDDLNENENDYEGVEDDDDNDDDVNTKCVSSSEASGSAQDANVRRRTRCVVHSFPQHCSKQQPRPSKGERQPPVSAGTVSIHLPAG